VARRDSSEHYSARAFSRSITIRGIDWSEFVIVTAADVPGKNHIQMISADQPCLAADPVNHCDEPIILLLAHPDKRRLPEAVAAFVSSTSCCPQSSPSKKARAEGNRLGTQYNNSSKSFIWKRAMSMRSGPPPRTSSKASIAPARRNTYTSKTTA
jgi:hypothetical protein